jgi:hypothetical protein
VAAPMADGGSGVGALRVPGELRPLNRRSCLEEGVTRSSNGGPGMAQRRCKRRRPMASSGRCGEPMAEGSAAAGACECGAWCRLGPTCTSHRSPLVPRTYQGSSVCLGVRVRRGTVARQPAVHDVVRARGADVFQGYTIQLNPLLTDNFSIFRN